MCSCFRLVVNYVTLAVGEVLLLILTVCSLAAIFPRVRKEKRIHGCGDGTQNILQKILLLVFELPFWLKILTKKGVQICNIL